MSGERAGSDNVEKALDGLPPHTRQALEHAVGKAQGHATDPLMAMLDEKLKAEPEGVKQPEPFRMPDPARLFFRPLEKFLIDGRPSQKTWGRIWRGALEPIWTWIEAHMTDDVARMRARLHDLADKVSSEDDPALVAAGSEFRKTLLPKLSEALARAEQTPESRRRFSFHFGGEYQLLELEDIAIVLKYKDVIDACYKNMPATLSHTSKPDVAAVGKIIRKFADIDVRLPYYVAVLLHDKLDKPAQLPFWATACAGSDDLRQVVSSPFAPLIEIALGDATHLAELCIENLTKPAENNPVALYARNYAMICRNMRAAIDFESQNSEWLRRLSEVRQKLSAAMGEELGQVFQLLRRNVRPLRAFGNKTPFPPDQFDLQRLCFLIRILNTIRSYVQEFALNELVNRLYGECESYLNLAIDSLQEELRTKFDDRRRIVLAYADAAVKVSTAWHGEDYAAVLKRSFDATSNIIPPTTQASA